MMSRTPLADFDVLAPTTLTENDAAWRDLRSRCPVAWTPHHGGHWIVSGYDEVATAFRDWETFSSARTDPAVSSITISGARLPLLVPEELDPPEWHGYRRVLAAMLSPQAAERLRPRARHWARTCLDAVIESGRCELVSDLAFPVPAAVTLEWLGFPESDWAMFSHAFHDAAAYPHDTPEYRAAASAAGEVLGRIAEEVEIRARSPLGDGLSTITHAEIDGQPIPRDMAEKLAFMTVGGGVDTTSALISAALWHLHRFPDDRRRLLDEPDLLDTATEEFLRVYPPARTHARTVTVDTGFAGCPMRAGDRVLLSEVAANRDPRAFPDAERFVLDRFPNRHLSFGAGIHRCPGSHLARITFTETLHEVLWRIPDYVLVDEGVLEYPNWSMIGGWAALPAQFTAGPRLG